MISYVPHVRRDSSKDLAVCNVHVYIALPMIVGCEVDGNSA